MNGCMLTELSYSDWMEVTQMAWMEMWDRIGLFFAYVNETLSCYDSVILPTDGKQTAVVNSEEF